MLQRRPALRFVLLLMCGIILAAHLKIYPIVLWCITLADAVLCGVLLRLNRWKNFTNALLLTSVVFLGMLLQSLQQTNFRSLRLDPKNSDESITVFGMIDSDPVQRERNLHWILATDSIYSGHSLDRTPRRIMILLKMDKGEQWTGQPGFGRRIELTGILEPFPFQRNPGEFDYGKYLALNDIQGVVFANGLGGIRTLESEERLNLRIVVHSIQQALYRIIDGLHTKRHASFLKGIVFGYSADLPEDVKQSFLDTGTIHILAVSGSNVAFVAFMILSVLSFLRLPRQLVRIISLFGLVMYMLITGSSPSVVRATIMAIVIISGTMLERKTDIYNSISVAAIILLLWNTNSLFDVGFQLSFGAVLSIVFFYPKLEMLIKKIPERYEEIKAIDVILKLFAVSMAAQIGTIPFTAYYFGRVSIISLIANIPVVPISGLNTFIGFAEIVFSYIFPWIAYLFAATNDFLIWFLLGFVQQASHVSFAFVEIWKVTFFLVAGYYAFILCLFNLQEARYRNWFGILFIAIINVILFSNLWMQPRMTLRATMIDVGQGDAILLESPIGRTILIDTGPSSKRFDAGERTIMPLLKRKGVTHLDYVVITHAHSDHIGGMLSILKSFPVDTLLLDVSNSGNKQVQECITTAKETKVGVKPVISGEQVLIDSTIRIYILHPSSTPSTERNLNNSSIVMKIQFGKTSLLLVGDAETAVEQKLDQRYKEFLACNILKVGHHGSPTGTSEEFLDYIHPREAIISVGNHNKFRHPSPWIIARLLKHSIRVQRTDRQGAIVVESNGNEWSFVNWQ